MDVTFNERESMLQEQAKDFLEREVTLDHVRAMEEDAKGYQEELWRKMAGLGWLGIAFPAEYGGEGFSFLDLVILTEQMGRTLAPSPFLQTVTLAGLTILEDGSDEQKKRLLPSIAKGDLIVSMAYIEPNKPRLGLEHMDLETTAQADGDGFVLNGEKHFAQYAHVSDHILTLAKDASSGLPVWLLVDRGSAGVETQHLETTGHDHQCHVRFKDVRVPAESRLSGASDASRSLSNALRRGSVAVCAYMAGAADKVLEFTVQYAKERVQFGRPIGTFQAVRHRCADMAVEVDGARFITYEAAWNLSGGLPSDLEVSVAKAYVSDAVRNVMASGHQAHGAIGFSEEHPMPLYSRRAKMCEVLFGNSNFHREKVAQELGL